MKIIDLVKSEFLKNYNLVKWLIIIIFLMLSVFVAVWFSDTEIEVGSNNIFDEQINHYEEQYEHLKDNPYSDSLKQEWYLFYYQNLIKNFKITKKYKDIDYDSWQVNLIYELCELEKLNFWLDKYLENKNLDINNEWFEDFAIDHYLNKLKNMSDDDLDILKEKIIFYEDKIQTLLDENKFYKCILFYKEYEESGDFEFIELISSDFYANLEFSDYIVENKLIDANDYRVKNIYQKNDLSRNSYSSFRVNKLQNKKYNEFASILDYSIKNNMKHDITYSNGGYSANYTKLYITSKNSVNMIFHLAIVVMLLTVITGGDIVSKEQNKGTLKLLLTSSNKRWKVLLSKFIYLVLHMYIIWFSALFIIFIYSGFKHGFSDLFTPKLIYQNGKVLEVNYLIYTVIEMFYLSIPMIAMISILFMLSTVTLNTTVTIGISTFMVSISPFLWHFIQAYRLKILAYTPIPYFMFSLVTTLSENYVKTMDMCLISEGYGIFISIVTIIICYLISNIVFIKRDIKNS